MVLHHAWIAILSQGVARNYAPEWRHMARSEISHLTKRQNILIISDLLPLTNFCVCKNEIIHPQDLSKTVEWDASQTPNTPQSYIQREASSNISYYFGIWRFIISFKFRNLPAGPCIVTGHLPTFAGISSWTHRWAFNNLSQCI